jgi:thermitase
MRFFRLGLLILLLSSLILPTLPAFADDHNDDQNIERILVKYRDDTDDFSRREVSRRHGDSDEGEITGVGVHVIKIPKGKLQAKLQEYSREKTIEFVEPDYIAYAIGTPSDAYFGSQWGMTKIQAPQAWDVTTGQPAIKIAILDTGVDQNHEDLAAKLVANRNFTTSATTDDLYGHGTHVAGVAAAVTNNAIGVAGVGYNTVIMNVKVLDDSGSGNYSWIANGIIWATDNGAKVISMSLGGSSNSLTLQNAVNYAWSRGVIVVAAAGNNGNSAPSYPAYYGNAIAVAASDANDNRASFSNYGSWVDVAAPGTGIYSTLPNHSNRIGLNYGSLNGTSMATPFVAGMAGLIWATSYGTDNVTVRSRIETTADKVAGTGTYWQFGRINAYRAVAPSAPPPPPDTTPPVQVTGLAVTTVNSSRLDLSWNANSEPDLKNYKVYRGTAPGGPYTLVSYPTANAYADTGLAAATTYYYTVSAVDVPGNEGTRSAETTGTTSPAPANRLHVHSITMSLPRDGSRTRGQAVITIVNASGSPVAGATVSGHWSGATSDTDSAVTSSSGQVTVRSNWVRRPAPGTIYTFTVDSLSLNGWTYDSAANVETSDSISVP